MELVVALVVFAVAVGALIAVVPLFGVMADAQDREVFVRQARSCAEVIMTLRESSGSGFGAIADDCPEAGSGDDFSGSLAWASTGTSAYSLLQGQCADPSMLELDCATKTEDGASYHEIALRYRQGGSSEVLFLQVPEQ